jgi:acyl-CoA thioesterase FadM
MSLSFHMPLRLPVEAFSPRQVARPAAVWRLFQEAALQALVVAGWPPDRLRAAGRAFVAVDMTVLHHRELRWGEDLEVETWMREFRRGILARRELRLRSAGALVASATQRWALVRPTGDGYAPVAAPAELQAAFPPGPEPADPVTLPTFTPTTGEESVLNLRCWHTWMDTLGHANHPQYLDWVEEAVAERVAAASGDPQAVVPVGERIRWRVGATAGQPIQIETRPVGRAGDATVFRHTVKGSDGVVVAQASTVRVLPGQET